jgi:hypothetical protein
MGVSNQDKIKYASYDPKTGLNIQDKEHVEYGDINDTKRRYIENEETENQDYLENPKIN